MKSKKVQQLPDKKELLNKLINKEFFAQSVIFEEFSEKLLSSLDIFLCNTDLDNKQQSKLVKLIEETFSEGVVIGINE